MLNSEERWGMHEYGSTSEKFVDFVESVGLQDLGLMGLEVTSLIMGWVVRIVYLIDSW